MRKSVVILGAVVFLVGMLLGALLSSFGPLASVASHLAEWNHSLPVVGSLPALFLILLGTLLVLAGLVAPARPGPLREYRGATPEPAIATTGRSGLQTCANCKRLIDAKHIICPVCEKPAQAPGTATASS